MAPGQRDSPFLLVEHGKDGLWHVHESRFDTCGILFNERQDACDYAAERARTKKDSMVLLREHQNGVQYLRCSEAGGHVEIAQLDVVIFINDSEGASARV